MSSKIVNSFNTTENGLSHKGIIKIFGENGYKILKMLSSTPKTVKELSHLLDLSEQAIYYHLKKFLDFGIVEYHEELERHAKTTVTVHRYELISNKFTINFSTNENKPFLSISSENDSRIPSIFKFLVWKRKLQGYLVVGSPIPHGKYDAHAQDGHFIGYLSFFLGKFLDLPQNPFRTFIKLDSEIFREGLNSSPLILLGGPKVNVITSDLQDRKLLPISFELEKTNTVRINSSSSLITDPLLGVIQLISNPWDQKDKNSEILIIAGASRLGTHVAVYSLIYHTDLVTKLIMESSERFVIMQGVLDNREEITDINFEKYSDIGV